MIFTENGNVMFFDGGTGTILQSLGLKGGELPETWNILRKEDIQKLHTDYLNAGARIIKSNTFGANPFKFPGKTGFSLEQIVTAAIENARFAVDSFCREHPQEKAYVALDMGPTGKLLESLGDLSFEDAVRAYAQVVRLGVSAGADCVLIETMNDTYELKAAILAVKENCDLPVLVTAAFDENAKLLTGGSPECFVALLEGLRVDALGVNCSLGPEQLKPVVKRICSLSSLPVIVNPNAGLPRVEKETGKTVFDVDPDVFARSMCEIVSENPEVCFLGGCCGTTPEHIRAMKTAVTDMLAEKSFARGPVPKDECVVSSASRCVFIGGNHAPIIVGERINPTGKSKFKQALRDNNIEYILQEGLAQEESGAHVLDVNVGLPDIDEKAMLCSVIRELQAVTNLPLQIDTSDFAAMEQAMRLYNGKAMINSVNGKQETMDAVFPLVKKYGGAVVALTLDEDGIPTTVEGRLAIAGKIYREAAKYGIAPKDIIVDALTMTVSTDSNAGKITLDTVRRVTNDLHGRTILGVSNISFGLPARPLLNASFFTMALESGLSAGIINPNLAAMKTAYDTFTVLRGFDEQCVGYIEKYADYNPAPAASNVGTPGAPGSVASAASEASASETALQHCIIKGLKDAAAKETSTRLAGGEDSMTLITNELVPALDVVGKAFEKGKMFLPQLLMSAEAAKACFEKIKEVLSSAGEKKGNDIPRYIILATVKGDIHDIGKNIVKVLLENYGYDVIDLGKDVPPEKIVEATREYDAKLVGLSALMTTTVVNMEATIKALREAGLPAKVMVGGAVLTQEYADMIHADRYTKDAMASVYYANEIFGR